MGKSFFCLLLTIIIEEILSGALPSVVTPKPKMGRAFYGRLKHPVIHSCQLELRQSGGIICHPDVTANVFAPFGSEYVAIEYGGMQHP